MKDNNFKNITMKGKNIRNFTDLPNPESNAGSIYVIKKEFDLNLAIGNMDWKMESRLIDLERKMTIQMAVLETRFLDKKKWSFDTARLNVRIDRMIIGALELNFMEQLENNKVTLDHDVDFMNSKNNKK